MKRCPQQCKACLAPFIYFTERDNSYWLYYGVAIPTNVRCITVLLFPQTLAVLRCCYSHKRWLYYGVAIPTNVGCITVLLFPQTLAVLRCCYSHKRKLFTAVRHSHYPAACSAFGTILWNAAQHEANSCVNAQPLYMQIDQQFLTGPFRSRFAVHGITIQQSI